MTVRLSQTSAHGNGMQRGERRLHGHNEPRTYGTVCARSLIRGSCNPWPMAWEICETGPVQGCGAQWRSLWVKAITTTLIAYAAKENACGLIARSGATHRRGSPSPSNPSAGVHLPPSGKSRNGGPQRGASARWVNAECAEPPKYTAMLERVIWYAPARFCLLLVIYIR